MRVLLVASHPVQYASPIFRLLAKDPRLEIQVAYCSMQGAEPHIDPDFGVEVKWDVPLLDGYPWMEMSNRSWFKSGSLKPVNTEVWRVIRSGHFDAVVLYTGYVCATFWMALVAAKLSHTAVLFGTDAHVLSPRDQKNWKVWLKRLFWPRLFRLADVVIVPSSGGLALMRDLGIPENRTVLTPYCVSNEWWTAQSERVDKLDVRSRWDIPADAVVVLFAAKLQPWKRPADLLRAFAAISAPNMYLVFAGDGSLRQQLESEAQSLGVAQRVRFLGFVNQSALPETYSSSDIFVLPSEYEPFGVVVNEAMLCGCCVIVSDRVGARFDLVREGETGFIYRGGDVDALAKVLSEAASDLARLKCIGRAARKRMETWSPAINVETTIQAIELSVGADLLSR
jgi:glycosyltransferase involved in cell wall biosynthesis